MKGIRYLVAAIAICSSTFSYGQVIDHRGSATPKLFVPANRVAKTANKVAKTTNANPTDFALVITNKDINGDLYTFSGKMTYTSTNDNVKRACTFTDVQLEYDTGKTFICEGQLYYAVLRITTDQVSTKVFGTVYKDVDWAIDSPVDNLATTIDVKRELKPKTLKERASEARNFNELKSEGF